MKAEIKSQSLAYLSIANVAVVNTLAQSQEQFTDDRIRDELHEIETRLNRVQNYIRKTPVTK